MIAERRKRRGLAHSSLVGRMPVAAAIGRRPSARIRPLPAGKKQQPTIVSSVVSQQRPRASRDLSLRVWC